MELKKNKTKNKGQNSASIYMFWLTEPHPEKIEFSLITLLTAILHNATDIKTPVKFIPKLIIIGFSKVINSIVYTYFKLAKNLFHTIIFLSIHSFFKKV